MERSQEQESSPNAPKKGLKLEVAAIHDKKGLRSRLVFEGENQASLGTAEEPKKSQSTEPGSGKVETQASAHDAQCGSNESSYSSSGASQQSSTSKLSKRSERLLKAQRSRAFRRILRKMKSQKKQYRHIEKIFSFKKQERADGNVAQDPYLVKPQAGETATENETIQFSHENAEVVKCLQ